MPRKKTANKAYMTDITKTQYDGFTDDVNELCRDVKKLDLTRKLDEAERLLNEKLHGYIPTREMLREEYPNASEQELEQRKKDLEEQCGMLEKLYEQIQNIKTFTVNFEAELDSMQSDLSQLMNYKNTDPDALNRKAEEDAYYEKLQGLMSHIEAGTAVFSGGKEKGFPHSIKAYLDGYNILNGYKEYSEENSVMSMAEEVLTDVEKLFTRTYTIMAKADRHKAEKEIEKEVDYDRQNLLDYGKTCYENPEYSLKTVTEKYDQAVLEKNTADAEAESAKAEYDSVNARLSEARENQNRLIEEKNRTEDERVRAESELRSMTEIADGIMKTRDQLYNVTFKIKFPGLSALDKAEGKKIQSLEEMLESVASGVDALEKGREFDQEKLNKIYDDIENIVKTRGDIRLKEFCNEEGTRYKYRFYPKLARDFCRVMDKLPEEYRLNYQELTIMQMKAMAMKHLEPKPDTKEKKEKKTNPAIWKCIVAMLKHLERYCPNEYVKQPILQDNITDCEDKSPKYDKELDSNPVHKKLTEYNELKKDRMALESEIVAMEAYDKKDKGFWTKENKTLYKNKKTELAKINKKIDTLRADKIHVDGASTVKSLTEESVNLSENIFSYSSCQMDVYLKVFEEYDQNTNMYYYGTRQAELSVFSEITRIHESIPEAVFRVRGNQYTKKNSTLGQYYAKLKKAQSSDEFRHYYALYKEELDKIKDSYNEAAIKNITDRVDTCRRRAEALNFDNRIEESNRQVTELTALLNEKKSLWNEKKDAASVKRQEMQRAEEELNKTNRFYDRKKKAEAYDPENKNLSAAKYDIDLEGKNYMLTMRQPFNVLSMRSANAKKKGHSDTKEFLKMTGAVERITELSDDVSLEDYRKAISDAKRFAGEYIRKKESQWFVNRRSAMRKYRLSYAKSIISLCDDQLEHLKEDFKAGENYNPPVKAYLKRTEPLGERNIDAKQEEKNKRELLKGLNDRRDEAIQLYLKSPEFMARESAKKGSYNERMKAEDDALTKQMEKKRKKLKASKNVDSEEKLIGEIKQRRDDLEKEQVLHEMKKVLKSRTLKGEEKKALEQKIKDIEEGRISVKANDINLAPEEEKGAGDIIGEDGVPSIQFNVVDEDDLMNQEPKDPLIKENEKNLIENN